MNENSDKEAIIDKSTHDFDIINIVEELIRKAAPILGKYNSLYYFVSNGIKEDLISLLRNVNLANNYKKNMSLRIDCIDKALGLLDDIISLTRLSVNSRLISYDEKASLDVFIGELGPKLGAWRSNAEKRLNA